MEMRSKRRKMSIMMIIKKKENMSMNPGEIKTMRLSNRKMQLETLVMKNQPRILNKNRK